MGGRSRKIEKDEYSDRLKWLLGLSNTRLEAYGKMSSHKLDQTKYAGDENWDRGKETLNGYMVDEYHRRHGFYPEWDRSSKLFFGDLYKDAHGSPESVTTNTASHDQMVGYRYLKSGEKVRMGDEYLSSGQDWQPVTEDFGISFGEKWTKNMYPFRRRRK